MARTLIVVGDATTGGGRVVSGSPDTDIDGKAIARVGDKATCSKHNCVATIMSGDDTLVFEGRAVARHGDRLSCACTLIAGKQSHVFVDTGGGRAPKAAGSSPAISPIVAAPLQALADREPVCEECLLAAAQSGAAFLGL
ncbi:PAAR domain-containing protein [Stenotrophomonas sp. ESTM1D_MKCIP4_1]|nr:PAAR domain-containing protein [Stenotrophomonas sp. ESTM1D_MKCIP4_1]